ncbi:succinylglutamate desuccinylase/aspartoacylase family protein [Reinekea marinisedimentorum]
MPVHVIRSKKPGPTVLVCAAIHGDELNGIDIVRRLIHMKSLRLTCGSLVLVPMVNVYGVLDQSRYLPDRRDLNRAFPGSAKGSFAGRVAEQFMTEIVEVCDYGIDLHTGAIHRSNLPQIRANLKDEETLRVARSFGVPVILNAELRDGSLRQAGSEKGIRFLVYEAGQALRFDEMSIRAGVRGVLNVLVALDMKKPAKAKAKAEVTTPYIANNSSWVRSSDSGIVSHHAQLGDHVKAGELLAMIRSPMGDVLEEVRASRDGIVIGKQNIPLTYEGEAMYHIAFFDENAEVASSVDAIQQNGIVI